MTCVLKLHLFGLTVQFKTYTDLFSYMGQKIQIKHLLTQNERRMFYNAIYEKKGPTFFYLFDTGYVYKSVGTSSQEFFSKNS